MTTPNYLKINARCVRCGKRRDVVAEIQAGYRDLKTYDIGDRIQWRTPPKRRTHTVIVQGLENEFRPENGTIQAEGYVECPLCKKDYFICVNIVKDKVVDAEIDLSKEPFVKGRLIENADKSKKKWKILSSLDVL